MEGKFDLQTVSKNIDIIKENIRRACEEAGRPEDSVKILAATKTVSAETINFAISKGIHIIGENRVQELLEKYDKIDRENAEIHFIGRLQTNKVKYIIDKVSMIHSVDSYKLACEIDKQAKKKGIVMDVLVEVNIGDEESKGGVKCDELEALLVQIAGLENVRVKGLMAIPPKCEEDENEDACGDSSKKIYKNQTYLNKIFNLFIDISRKKLDNIYMYELSVGMSDDYEAAAFYGATIVRPGRAIFGSR